LCIQMVLSKCINSQMDMMTWKSSQAFAHIMSFIEGVNVCVRAKSINDRQTMSPVSCEFYSFLQSISKVIELLNQLDAQVDLTPLEVNPQRYGNKAFCDYYLWLCKNAFQMIVEILGLDPATGKLLLRVFMYFLTEHLDEIVKYLTESVGNSFRIDYGTGHELSFIAFIISLFKIGYLKQPETPISGPATQLNDYAASGLYILSAYLKLVRHLQTYFRMEPAGSHGVWSLDDFQFVPYIWGSSQIIGTGLYEPSDIPNKEIAEKEANSNLLFSCINYIYQVKTGPFAEHSSCLQSLSNVPNWEKVNSGMIKMYKGEVLDKFPVVQHFLFGQLLKFEPLSSLQHVPEAFPSPLAYPSRLLGGPTSYIRSPFIEPTGDP
uniref:Serine/threonine-protein phosphatase 2A activator n=1 Tax=Hymenolepis diminuta TaxID=6216 RepID=A0A0R3S885_HYMDI